MSLLSGQGGVKDASAASWSYLEWQLEDELLAEEGAGEEGEEDAPSGRPDFVIETSNQATSADAAQRTYMLQDGMNTEERHKLIRAKYQEKRFMDLNKVGEMLAQGPGELDALLSFECAKASLKAMIFVFLTQL